MALERHKPCRSPRDAVGALRDTDIETDTNLDSDTDSDSNVDSVSEAESASDSEYYRKRITEHEAKGPAKAKHADVTKKMVNRETEHWERCVIPIRLPTCTRVANGSLFRFCRIIRSDANETLRKCEAQTFKTYFEWRKKISRIKKVSTVQSYWKRLSLAYINLTGGRMESRVLIDMRNGSTNFHFLDGKDADHKAVDPRTRARRLGEGKTGYVCARPLRRPPWPLGRRSQGRARSLSGADRTHTSNQWSHHYKTWSPCRKRQLSGKQ